MKRLIVALSLIISSQLYSQKIPIQVLPSGHIIAKAKVDGKEGNFIFDTGGGINLFFDNFAKDLKQKSTYNFLTAYRATGERIDAPLYENDEVLFAGKKFVKVPYSTFDMKLDGIDGLISLQMFGDTDFIIDFNKNEIELTDFSTMKNLKSFDIQLSTNADKSTDISTYITLNDNIKIQVLLDSGAGKDSFWLSDKLISTLKIDKTKLDLKEMKSEFNENVTTKFYRGNINSISNKYVTLKDPKVVFVEGLIYEGKTSINWFGNKIGISLKNKKMYILD
ncbi:aspartyl protease family protein [Empedobacter falsenii]|uniref:aspartyl protease family protein n=1 Tax=Empedobacter falsenii TaxID=343874 RepID=UPI002577F1D3|nr:aspartyl protease family protein [Empedobacter falsenii]MDM1297150.1 aspartyl protease family protein [Empedobacter falsenii]MDM1316943.1 aspartyl protease family protein [Empedobacter falsenii]